MLDLGNKIIELRKQNNLTQKELGDKLNVSAQAVSKWEKNTSQPDFDTIVRISELFNVSLSEFTNKKEETSIIDNRLVCSVCCKSLNNEEVFSKSPKIVCNECHKRYIKEQEDIANDVDINENNKFNIKKTSLKKGLITSAIISIVLLTLGLLGLTTELKNITTLEYIITTIVLSLLVFTFIFQIRCDGIVNEIVTGSIGKTISMLGIIFSLDIGSIVFAIAYKFIIAPLIVLGIALFVFCGGCIIAILISPFTFPFALAKQIQETKEEK